MSRILPILFNAEMVQAILDNRKTNTRRLIKFPVNKYTNEVPNANKVSVRKNTMHSDKVSFSEEPFYCFDVKPPYQRGDILYVRETWYKDKTGRILYKANYSDTEKFYCNGQEIDMKWKPSIHMPKTAARIWLKVINVRAERLQDITKEQIEKEGIEDFCKKCRSLFSECDNCANEGSVIEDFKELWNSTIKKTEQHLYGWDANPWVWVIEFERCEEPKK